MKRSCDYSPEITRHTKHTNTGFDNSTDVDDSSSISSVNTIMYPLCRPGGGRWRRCAPIPPSFVNTTTTLPSLEDDSSSNSSSSSSNSSSSSSDSSSNTSSRSNSSNITTDNSTMMYENQDFYPDEVEQQIIRSVIASICRRNMSDWNLDSCMPNCDYMSIVDLALIEDDGREHFYSIATRLIYKTTHTICDIEYYCLRGQDSEPKYLQICWTTDIHSSNIVTIIRRVQTTTFFFFQNTVVERCDIDVFDCRDFSWCYFQDARLHLDRIRS